MSLYLGAEPATAKLGLDQIPHPAQWKVNIKSRRRLGKKNERNFYISLLEESLDIPLSEKSKVQRTVRMGFKHVYIFAYDYKKKEWKNPN